MYSLAIQPVVPRYTKPVFLNHRAAARYWALL
jgi:hypothetical protein